MGRESKKTKRKYKIIKIVLAIMAVILIVGMIFYMVPIIQSLFTDEGKDEYKDKVVKAGIPGMFMVGGLEFLKVFLAFIPGEPIEIVAGMCYGKWLGTFIIMISAAIGTIVVYELVRRYGRRFIYHFVSKEKIKRVESMKILKNKKKLEIGLLVLFVAPFVPKDVIIYLSALLPINPTVFLLISILGRFPSVFSSTFAGENIAKKDFKMILWIYIITYAILFGALLIVKVISDLNKKHKKKA